MGRSTISQTASGWRQPANICHSLSSDDSLHSGHRFTGKVQKYLLRELAAAALAPNTCRQ
jgi:hypothetical protein